MSIYRKPISIKIFLNCRCIEFHHPKPGGLPHLVAVISLRLCLDLSGGRLLEVIRIDDSMRYDRSGMTMADLHDGEA